MNDFENAITYATNNVNNISDEDKLQLYKYYKQYVIGDCNIPKPSIFSIRDRAKYNSWNSVKGLSKNDAIELYINTLTKYGFKRN